MAPSGSSPDRIRALKLARHPGRSKFGEFLLRNSNDQEKDLVSRIERIDKYYYRCQKQNDVKKNVFLTHRENNRIDPMIIIERGPSINTLLRYQYGADIFNEDPGYMRPFHRNQKPVSLLPTLDAFSVERKRKRNVWQMEEKEKKFKSLLPSQPLSRSEQALLQRSHDFHHDISTRGLQQATLAKQSSLPKSIKSALARVSPIDYVADLNTELNRSGTVFLTQSRDDELKTIMKFTRAGDTSIKKPDEPKVKIQLPTITLN